MTTQKPTRPLILVADDDPDLLRLVEIQLKGDFDLLQTVDGVDCIRMARAHKPDVILLDMKLPKMDGSSVLATLLQDSETKDIPVVCFSALVEVEDRVRGLESGAVDYITKPADRRELVARLRAATRRRAERDDSADDSDPDTGLPGRKSFEARLDEEVHRSTRSTMPFCILVVDVDSMAALNEQLDTQGGNLVLARIGRVLRSNLRVSDVLFRYGGDEFAALLPDSDAGTAWIAAERLREAVTQIEHSPLISVSIGIAECAPGHSADELMAKAEIALFRAKESGGNMSWRADDPRRRALNPLSLSEELTVREWDVLAHLAQRRTELDIAQRLGISSGTVRSHKARIRRKLHVAPDIRLADFVRDNFQELSAGLTKAKAWRQR